MIARYLPTRFIKYIYDVGAIFISFLGAHYLINYPPQEQLVTDIVFLFFYNTILIYVIGIHRHLWRYTSIHTLIDTTIYSCCLTVGYFAWSIFAIGNSESLIKICMLLGILPFMLLNFPRVITRLAYEQSKIVKNTEQIKIILIGAGKGGELFLRETRKRTVAAYQVEAVLDDNPELWGKKLFGAKVHGSLKDLSKLSAAGDIDMVVLAIPSLNRKKLIEITKTAEELNLQIKILPSFDKMLMVDQISPENISMEDLLGRDSITLETQEVLSFIQNKTVLITGAGGSIGSEICRQLIDLQPKTIILVDHSEYNLYKISWDLEHTYQYTNFTSILANVTDHKSMDRIFAEHHPDIIFHAAAYKHVPLLESQIFQAVQNNLVGTKIVAELASQHHCEKFILISTDKAVNPTNIMGATKRMAEIFCQNLNEHSPTNYVTVRFGNVLDSAGSVVPLFKKQLQQGGPLTVTHPDITRFFMSIPEASQLVLQAAAMGKGGEIFVLDMGDPIKIAHLAERLITLSGQRPYKDIDIIFTGLRAGEKLYEELFYQNEDHNSTQRKKIFLAQSKVCDFSFLQKQIETLEEYLRDNDKGKTLDIILQIVPEAKIAGVLL
jgi:FlaA1/EpsC-like NDP-sugar epimerase